MRHVTEFVSVFFLIGARRQDFLIKEDILNMYFTRWYIASWKLDVLKKEEQQSTATNFKLLRFRRNRFVSNAATLFLV